jgi:hypothetical protein
VGVVLEKTADSRTTQANIYCSISTICFWWVALVLSAAPFLIA